ncbi:MAG: hypothetical protein J6S40_08460 [Thermoguttaceae bacterium]|nr:hypothetical protein [Thermoguttaceae bacterium]
MSDVTGNEIRVFRFSFFHYDFVKYSIPRVGEVQVNSLCIGVFSKTFNFIYNRVNDFIG